MKIIKVEKSDGRQETKGCRNGAGKILEQLGNILFSETYKALNYEVVNDKGDLFLGGDHSISNAIFSKNIWEGVLKIYSKDLNTSFIIDLL